MCLVLGSDGLLDTPVRRIQCASVKGRERRETGIRDVLAQRVAGQE